ncbi:hypothetical protein HGRIS_011750 [Hohenbuehelia grisea]|uniref:Uncharacterized protein n=1 Tax=Hohenbuehelia grisea TaxID=104357 RepID=A0ABR3JW23_9AGAR
MGSNYVTSVGELCDDLLGAPRNPSTQSRIYHISSTEFLQMIKYRRIVAQVGESMRSTHADSAVRAGPPGAPITALRFNEFQRAPGNPTHLARPRNGGILSHAPSNAAAQVLNQQL